MGQCESCGSDAALEVRFPDVTFVVCSGCLPGYVDLVTIGAQVAFHAAERAAGHGFAQVTR